jgi:hypothetical protein
MKAKAMRRSILLLLILSIFTFTYGQLQLKASGVKWEETYSFDKCNNFKIEFYAKNNELMRTQQYKTFYQSDGENFEVKAISNGVNMNMETVIDKKNEVAIQVFGSGGAARPFYNAGGFKYPNETDLKKLELIATNEIKDILGISCKKYTYTYKKIFGEVWITDKINLPNDLGVFRACKMAALHNTLSVPGFVMEMTTEDARGGKTLMKTESIKTDEKYVIDFKGVEMKTAINRVNYFSF